MKKRTEFLLVSLVLSGAAVAAAMTSDDGLESADAVAIMEPAIVTEPHAAPVDTVTATEADVTPAEPETRGNPVVYEMNIPAEALSDY